MLVIDAVSDLGWSLVTFYCTHPLMRNFSREFERAKGKYNAGGYENRTMRNDCTAIVFDLHALRAVIVRFARIRSRTSVSTLFGYSAQRASDEKSLHLSRGAARTESPGP